MPCTNYKFAIKSASDFDRGPWELNLFEIDSSFSRITPCHSVKITRSACYFHSIGEKIVFARYGAVDHQGSRFKNFMVINDDYSLKLFKNTAAIFDHKVPDPTYNYVGFNFSYVTH